MCPVLTQTRYLYCVLIIVYITCKVWVVVEFVFYTTLGKYDVLTMWSSRHLVMFRYVLYIVYCISICKVGVVVEFVFPTPPGKCHVLTMWSS